MIGFRQPRSFAMTIDRRAFVTGLAAAAAPSFACAQGTRAAAPISAFGIDAATLGVRAGSHDDQTPVLQRAIDQAAAARAPLALAPGVYRASDLALPAGAQITGIRGATRLVSSRGRPLFVAPQADQVTLAGLVLDGAGLRLPQGLGLVSLLNGRGVKIMDCAIMGAGGHGIHLEGIAGEITGTTVSGAADVAIISRDAKGLTIVRNIVRVRGNRIHDCTFSAVRGNSASGIEIIGNACSALGEVALYSEFSFEGAVIANNTVDGAEIGVSVANFNEGGRIAVVQGNIFRNLSPRHGKGEPASTRGIGIYVEADTAVTGNVVENASFAGVIAGWGRFLRDVTITGNVVRSADIGVGVSVVPGAGGAIIANNMISGSRRGAILGMDHIAVVTEDLAKDGAARYAQLAITGNRVN